MADLQVVFLQDILPITQVEPVDIAIPTIRIKGKNIISAATVLVNGIESPSFIVVSKHELLAEIPDSIVGDIVRSVAVLSSRITTTERSVLTFRLGGSSARVTGILRLVQRYVLMLLSTPGSDVLNKSLGGGLLELVGKTVYGASSGENIRATVQQSVGKAETDLKRVQAAGPGLEPDESLISAVLTDVHFEPRTTTLAIRVQVESAAGSAALANLFI